MARIALAEDDVDIRRMASITLQSLGHQVDEFEDGAAALLALAESPYDLLVSDVMMPRLDGISLCRAVRARDRRLPIVLMSALSQEEEILEGYEAGADDYVVKPFAPAVLRARVRRALQEAESGTELAEHQRPLEWPPALPARFDRYELVEKLGEGGTSTVYRGVDPTGHPVAVKLFLEGLEGDRGALGRFFREVTVLRELDSPGLVRILDSGHAQGHFFLVMNFVSGRSAGELLHELGPLPIEQVARLGMEVAQALGELTSRGLLHRDVKPANIMVEPSGQSVLIDFGLAKGDSDPAVTDTGDLMGTAPYMAPELIRAAGAESVASELYALGASIYELLSGRPPFTGEGYAVLRQIAEGGLPPSLAAAREGLPAELVTLIKELMQPEVSLRPRDPLQVAERFAGLAG